MPRATSSVSAAPSSLIEVARRAGVSPATVSRVFNRPELVTDDTRARVRAAVDALQFVPNQSARSLSRGRSHVMAALIPHISYSIFADYIDAAQQVCTAAGYNLVMGTYHFDADEELRLARNFVATGVDAMILVGYRHDPALFELLHARGVHYVCTDVYDPKSRHPCVGYDNRGAGRRIAEHLLALGHERFAVVTGSTGKNDRMAIRLAGFNAALRKKGLKLAPGALFEGRYTLADGRRGFAQVHAAVQPTAVMCGNDVIAIGALLEARDRKLKVPQHLSIVGFDNLEWAAEFSPSLTTMNVPCTDMGGEAARTLLQRIDGHTQQHAIELPLTLIERETTAPPPRTPR